MASSAPKLQRHISIDYRHPIMAGQVYKQNKIGSFFNKRYFALYPKYLVYYAHETDFKKDIELNTLEHRHGAYHLDGVYLTHCQKKPEGAKYCFVMHIPAKCNCRHEVLLNCKSQADRKIWMEKLQAQNTKLKSRNGHEHHHGHHSEHHHHHGHHGEHHHHHGHHEQHSQGNGHLPVPHELGHQRKASYGGEGELNVKDEDSDEDHQTECPA